MLKLIAVTALIAGASALPTGSGAGYADPKVPAFAANVYGPPQSLHLHVVPTKQLHTAAAPAAYVQPAAAFAAYAAPARYAAPVPAAGHAGASQFSAYNSLAKGAVQVHH